MRILYVYGEGDYAAMTFDDDIGIDNAMEIIKDRVNVDVLLHEDGMYGRVLEFGDVDPAFIEFIRNKIQDYDDSKHSNFYIIN